jgi:hypothetical protein
MSGIDLQDLRKTGGIIKLQNKEFVTFSGLLVTAHSNGLESITPELLRMEGERVVFKATVKGARGTFTGHGDADPGNVKRGMQGAVLRMAETRAVCRALRMYLGIGMTAREELPGDEPAEKRQPQRGQPDESRSFHPSWRAGNKPFLAELKKRSLGYDAVAAYCEKRRWGRPAQWEESARKSFLSDLDNGTFSDLYQPPEGE